MAAPTPLLLLLGALLVSSAAWPLAANASAAPTVSVSVGVVLPGRNLRFPFAWPRVAPALSLALEALQPQLSLDGLAVRTAFASNENKEGRCDEHLTALKAVELKGSHDPDVLLGLSSFAHTFLLAPFVELWRLPLLRAGAYVRSPSPGEVYAGPLGPSLSAFQFRLLQHFNWTRRTVVVFSSSDWDSWRYCDFMLLWREGQSVPEGPHVYIRIHQNDELDRTVRYIQAHGREDLHQIMHLAHAQNMTNGDYVFFYLDPFGEHLRAVGYREAHKPWQSKGGQDTRGLQEAFQTVLVITPHEPQTSEYRQFEKQVILRAQRDFGVAINDSLGHLVAGCYHDVLLLYLRALNETLHEGGTKRNTSRILEKMRSLKFQGVTGTVSINSNNAREMDFDLWAMRDVETGEFQVVGNYIASEKKINWTGPILWKKGNPPLDNPPCVFNKDNPFCVNKKTT